MKRKKVLVAGGTGFLGRHIINKLEEKQIPYITSSLSLGTDFMNLKQTLSFFKKHKPDVVIHAAAFVGGIQYGIEHAGEFYYKNMIMSAHLIEASRLYGVAKFISPIGNCAYPEITEGTLSESELWNGPMHSSVMQYGIVRRAQLIQSWAYQKQYGMQFTNIILPNLYGPGDHFDDKRSHALSAMLLRMIEAKKKNYPEVVVWGTGKPVREWLYATDAAEALVRSIDIETGIDPVNVGVGYGISIKQLAKLLKKTVKYKGKLMFDTSKPDGALYKVMDVKKCNEIFKWMPVTKLEDGILQTYAWYQKELEQKVPTHASAKLGIAYK